MSTPRDPGLDAFVRHAELRHEDIKNANRYPFNLPAFKNLPRLYFHPEVTFFVGENGSGKSTLVEALAVAAGFNAEGGSRNQNFATRRSESPLHEHLTLARGIKRPKSGYFLRAESFFNLASEVEKDAQTLASHGGTSFHEMSHGEAFLALVQNRFGGNGLFILDEPEAALSPQRQLAFLSEIHARVRNKCQFIISTHSPILLAYPGALIYSLTDSGITHVQYEETEHYTLTRAFLLDRERYLRHLFND